MKTQYYTATSLDGYIADAAHSLDWLHRLGEAEAADWEAFIAGVGAVAMGSTTYEWVLEHHVRPGTDRVRPWPYSQPSWVFSSRSLPAVEGADIRFVRGDVRPVHEEMREAAEGRNVWIVGGGDLAGQFHDAGLLDELVLTVGSVTLGAGAPLLPRAITDPPLRLVSAERMGNGFARLVYEVRGRDA